LGFGLGRWMDWSEGEGRSRGGGDRGEVEGVRDMEGEVRWRILRTSGVPYSAARKLGTTSRTRGMNCMWFSLR
jgi:hypothetical protein